MNQAASSQANRKYNGSRSYTKYKTYRQKGAGTCVVLDKRDCLLQDHLCLGDGRDLPVYLSGID